MPEHLPLGSGSGVGGRAEHCLLHFCRLKRVLHPVSWEGRLCSVPCGIKGNWHTCSDGCCSPVVLNATSFQQRCLQKAIHGICTNLALGASLLDSRRILSPATTKRRSTKLSLKNYLLVRNKGKGFCDFRLLSGCESRYTASVVSLEVIQGCSQKPHFFLSISFSLSYADPRITFPV